MAMGLIVRDSSNMLSKLFEVEDTRDATIAPAAAAEERGRGDSGDDADGDESERSPLCKEPPVLPEIASEAKLEGTSTGAGAGTGANVEEADIDTVDNVVEVRVLAVLSSLLSLSAFFSVADTTGAAIADEETRFTTVGLRVVVSTVESSSSSFPSDNEEGLASCIPVMLASGIVVNATPIVVGVVIVADGVAAATFTGEGRSREAAEPFPLGLSKRFKPSSLSKLLSPYDSLAFVRFNIDVDAVSDTAVEFRTSLVLTPITEEEEPSGAGSATAEVVDTFTITSSSITSSISLEDDIVGTRSIEREVMCVAQRFLCTCHQ
jgi:hypothetical protein